MVRELAVKSTHTASFFAPADNGKPFHARDRTRLLALPNEDAFDPPQFPRDSIGTRTQAGFVLRASPIYLALETDLCSKIPAYIAQSVLNL
jgi:hypothetical protein